MEKFTATDIATRHHIDLTKDFYTLTSSDVGRVLDAAKEAKYRQPANANGSRGRYFFERLKRAVK